MEFLEERRMLHGQDAASATRIEVAETVDGQFSQELEEDWFVFSGKANTSYLVEVPEQHVRIANAEGQSLVPSFLQEELRDAKVFELAEDTEVYFVITSADGSVVTDDLHYELIVEEFSDEQGNSYASAAPVFVGDIVDATLKHAADVDVFQFAGTANEEYIFSVPDFPRFFSLAIAQGDMLLDVTGTSTDFVSWTPDQDEDVFVIVQSTLSGHILDYELQVFRASDFGQPGDRASLALRLEPGETISETMDSDSDTDWYVVSSAVDSLIHIDAQTTEGQLGAELDVEVLNSHLERLTSSIGFPLVFRQPTNQDVFLSVTQKGAVEFPLPYDLTVSIAREGAADFDAAQESSFLLPNDRAILVDTSTPETWYRFDSIARQAYDVSANFGNVSLFTADGTALGGASVKFDLDQPVFVRLSSSSDAGYDELTVRRLLGDDHGNTTDTATPFVGTLMNGEVSVGDEDWFVFQPDAGSTYRFDAVGFELTLWDDLGTRIDDEVGSYIQWTASSNDSVFVRLVPPDDLLEFDYGLQIRDFATLDTEGQGLEAATNVELGQVTAGDIDSPDDVDWFQATVRAGTEYTVSVTGTDDVQVRTEGGTEPIVEAAIDGQELRFNVVEDQVVTFRVAGVRYAQPYSILFDEHIDDHGSTPSRATVLAGNRWVQGLIEQSRDVDYFRFTAEAGSFVTVDYRGVDSADGHFRVLDERNLPVTDTNVSFRQFSFVAQSTATFSVEVSQVGAATGGYEILLTRSAAPVVDHPNQLAVAKRIGNDIDVITGTLPVDDEDWFVFEVQADQPYVFETNSSLFTTRLSNQNGRVLAEAPIINGTFSQTVNLYISVSNSTAQPLDFQLKIVPYEDDHGESFTNATAITDLSEQTGSFDVFGDIDAFTFLAEPGIRYDVEIDNPLTDLILLNEQNQILGQNISSESIQFEVLRTERVMLSSAYVSRQDFPQEYTIRISQTLLSGEEDHGSTPATATELVRGEVGLGVVPNASDVDVFRVSMRRGETLSASLFLDDRLSNNVRIVDALGTPLAANFVPGELVWEAPNSSDYFIEVVGSQFEVGDYRLDVSYAPHPLDGLCGLLVEEGYDAEFDFIADGRLDHLDLDALIEGRLGTKRGDANLDGEVGFRDFLQLSRNFGEQERAWQQGNFDCDHEVGFTDFLFLSRNFGSKQ